MKNHCKIIAWVPTNITFKILSISEIIFVASLSLISSFSQTTQKARKKFFD